MSEPAIADPEIAGKLRASDWYRAKATLQYGGTPQNWELVFSNFLRQRLELRYLNPIKLLQDNGTFQGEGFSIVAIQCTLLEFLAASIEGKYYRYVRKGDPALDRSKEYSNSSELFTNFLITARPFNKSFDSALAGEFYSNIRCGLLHEAATKNGWTIRAKSTNGKIIDGGAKVVFRDEFHAALLEFIDWYKKALPADAALQQAFVQKMDSLCM
jgi:hypothetical protein